MRLERSNHKRVSAAEVACASARFAIGEIGVACSEKGLREVSIRRSRSSATGHAQPPSSRASSARDPKATLARRALAEIGEFLEGRRREFSVPLDLQGTPFQLEVWNALRQIPYGETRSYADIARSVGRPKAARAVGMANHWNPVAIVVPCHRVVASDGSLGGYAGGLDLKTRLLRLESGE